MAADMLMTSYSMDVSAEWSESIYSLISLPFWCSKFTIKSRTLASCSLPHVPLSKMWMDSKRRNGWQEGRGLSASVRGHGVDGVSSVSSRFVLLPVKSHA